MAPADGLVTEGLAKATHGQGVGMDEARQGGRKGPRAKPASAHRAHHDFSRPEQTKQDCSAGEGEIDDLS